MTITKRPAASSASAIEEFIERAPDGRKGYAPEQARPRKATISLGVDPLLLARVDALAVRLGISRAATIAMAIAQFTGGYKGGGATEDLFALTLSFQFSEQRA
jgi:hypothetical protein